MLNYVAISMFISFNITSYYLVISIFVLLVHICTLLKSHNIKMILTWRPKEKRSDFLVVVNQGPDPLKQSILSLDSVCLIRIQINLVRNETHGPFNFEIWILSDTGQENLLELDRIITLHES